MTDSSAPPEVLTSAQEHGLGALTSIRKEGNPFVAAATSLVLAALIFGGLWLSSLALEHVPPGVRSIRKAVGFLLIFACLFMVVCIVYAVVTLIRGNRSYYVFADGFVYRRNRTVQAYRWQEIAELRARLYTTGDNAGKVSEYQLVPGAGRQITVPLEVVDGRDDFIDALIAGMTANGRPIA